MTEGSTTGRQDHIRVSQVLEECWQTQGVHATRDDWGGLWHALPVPGGSMGHQQRPSCNMKAMFLSEASPSHLAEAHGAHVDAAGANNTRELGVHESSVATLSLRAGHGTVAGTMVVQELLGEVAGGRQ